jgi:hypothetical protein
MKILLCARGHLHPSVTSARIGLSGLRSGNTCFNSLRSRSSVSSSSLRLSVLGWSLLF